MTCQEKILRFWISIYLVITLTEEARVSAVSCGGNITNVISGQVTSPLYPENYPKNSNCRWRLTSTTGQAIKLNIEHLDIKETFLSSGTEHCYDRLHMYYVRNGKLKKISSDNFCASSISELPRTEFFINASSPLPNVVLIYFTSDNSHEYSGFSIAFEMDIQPTTIAATTHAQLSAEPTNSSYMIGFVDQHQGNNADNSSVTFVLVGVGLVLLLLCLVILVVVLKRRKKQVPPRNDIIFENVREEAEDMGTDEYGRARENTYVEIPLLPNEETDPSSNGRLSVTLRRDSRTSSFDSISRAKLQVALESSPERPASTSSQTQSLANPTDCVYHMAEETNDDVDEPYLRPRSFKNQETNQVYAMASEITGSEKTAEDNLPPSSNIASGSSSQTSNYESKKDSAESENQHLNPESLYDVPSSPPFDPPKSTSESFYDRPRAQPRSKFSFTSNAPDGPSTESKYCTMKGPFESKDSPSNSLSSGSSKEETKTEPSIYMPMMSQK